jgi:hypothetical protein
MMTKTKRPPPDSVGNIRGRMAKLRETAHAMVMGGIHIVHVDEKGKGVDPGKRETPTDYEKLLADTLKELAPEFKKLENRLKKCPKEATVSREDRDARKAADQPAKKPTKKPTKPADTRTRAEAQMNGRKKNVASSVLDGGDDHTPLSREGALTEGVAQDHKPEVGDILDFMQSTLD